VVAWGGECGGSNFVAVTSEGLRIQPTLPVDMDWVPGRTWGWLGPSGSLCNELSSSQLTPCQT
jgi:hypothetical protein